MKKKRKKSYSGSSLLWELNVCVRERGRREGRRERERERASALYIKLLFWIVSGF